jgi:TetR/AcrR family transcriptional regulator
VVGHVPQTISRYFKQYADETFHAFCPLSRYPRTMLPIDATTAEGANDRQAITAERRQRIVDASRRVFLERGLVRARTRQIAEAAGVKEAILYSHFASKEEIFSAAIFDPLEALISEIFARVDLLGTADEHTRQRIFVEGHIRFIEVMKEVVPLFGVALYSNVEVGRRFFTGRLLPLFNSWFKLTERSVEGWSHRNANPRTVAMAAWGMHFGMALDAAMTDDELDVTGTARKVADVLYYGLLRPEPSGKSKRSRKATALPPR